MDGVSREVSLSERHPSDWASLAQPRASTERFETYGADLDRVPETDGVACPGISAVDDRGIDIAHHRATLDDPQFVLERAQTESRIRDLPITSQFEGVLVGP